MKIILAITCCNQNKGRIENQVNNLKWSLMPSGVEFIPIFVFGKGGDIIGIPFKTMVVDVEEKYTNLHLKCLEAYKRINKEYDFDFVLKIDDDTKINLEKFNEELVKGKDYIGRFVSGNSPSRIILELDRFNIHKTININPEEFEQTQYQFATGDCYFLSKKAIQHICKSNFKPRSSVEYAEDRMFGLILKDKYIVKYDINLINKFNDINDLQVTADYFSIHPINEVLYQSLIGLKAIDQLDVIAKNKSVNLLKRKIYLESLEYDIKEAVMKFLNMNKTIGLG